MYYKSIGTRKWGEYHGQSGVRNILVGFRLKEEDWWLDNIVMKEIKNDNSGNKFRPKF